MILLLGHLPDDDHDNNNNNNDGSDVDVDIVKDGSSE
jgi:hypothetical protein